ncbi:hypothetical protein COU36_05080, partial [Candidatus Micrarchaeota archaeon CG10_big_fil_rev_8_21_14_0_10_59_7]
LVSALECWDDHPTSAWAYSVGLCRSNQLLGYWYQSPSSWGPFYGYINGRITATQPTNSSNVRRIFLTAYTGSSPYPATLKCYQRMGTSPNYWWLYKATCTLNSGMTTNDVCPAWNAAGCPFAENGGPSNPPTTPQGPFITIDWSSKNTLGGKTTAAVATVGKPRIRKI